MKLTQALRATKKLLVVRHPFERLLSAYRDKLENSVAGREHGTLHFYRKYGSKIVEKYRGKSRQVIDRDVRYSLLEHWVNGEACHSRFLRDEFHAAWRRSGNQTKR